MASGTEVLKFQLYFILIRFSVSSHMGQMAFVLGSTALGWAQERSRKSQPSSCLTPFSWWLQRCPCSLSFNDG